MNLHLPRLSAIAVFATYATTLLAAAPTPRDILFSCMEEQRSLPPAVRAATCQCFVEKVQTARFRFEAAIASETKAASLRGNVVKECLASEYHRF